MTKMEDLPPTAQTIVCRVAKRYGLEAASLLEPRQRSPEAKAARREAICELDEAKLPDGRTRRFSLPDISAWFRVSRNSIYTQRAKSPKFTPRRAPNTLTA